MVIIQNISSERFYLQRWFQLSFVFYLHPWSPAAAGTWFIRNHSPAADGLFFIFFLTNFFLITCNIIVLIEAIHTCKNSSQYQNYPFSLTSMSLRSLSSTSSASTNSGTYMYIQSHLHSFPTGKSTTALT